jgi:hypothetical protein
MADAILPPLSGESTEKGSRETIMERLDAIDFSGQTIRAPVWKEYCLRKATVQTLWRNTTISIIGYTYHIGFATVTGLTQYVGRKQEWLGQVTLRIASKLVLGKTASKKEVDKVEIRRSNKPKLTFTQIMRKQACHEPSLEYRK